MELRRQQCQRPPAPVHRRRVPGAHAAPAGRPAAQPGAGADGVLQSAGECVCRPHETKCRGVCLPAARSHKQPSFRRSAHPQITRHWSYHFLNTIVPVALLVRCAAHACLSRCGCRLASPRRACLGAPAPRRPAPFSPVPAGMAELCRLCAAPQGAQHAAVGAGHAIFGPRRRKFCGHSRPAGLQLHPANPAADPGGAAPPGRGASPDGVAGGSSGLQAASSASSPALQPSLHPPAPPCRPTCSCL